MKPHGNHSHTIDFLFPVILFFVFTLSALVVLLLAANTYQSTVEDSSLNDTARTSLSYISEKIHQNDMADSVSLGTFDGCKSLILRQNYDGQNYFTYIYVYENELKELFLKEGAQATAESGRTILAVEKFSMESLSPYLLRFSCTDEQGQEASVTVGLKAHR